LNQVRVSGIDGRRLLRILPNDVEQWRGVGIESWPQPDSPRLTANSKTSLLGRFPGRDRDASTLGQVSTVAVQDAIQDLPHCAKAIHLLVQFSLSRPR
jgi:hypothetical protein